MRAKAMLRKVGKLLQGKWLSKGVDGARGPRLGKAIDLMAGAASGNRDDRNVRKALTNLVDDCNALCVRQEQVTDEKVRLAPSRRFQSSRQPCPSGHAMAGPPKGGRKSPQYLRLIIDNGYAGHRSSSGYQ
jgi:hypothetical protein